MIDRPSSINLANSTNYQLIIPKCPHVTFFCNAVKLPNVVGAGAKQTSLHADIYHPGDHLEFDDLNLTFNLDADLKNWNEIFKWMKDYGMPIDPTPDELEDDELVCDIEVIVTSNQKLPKQRFVFVNAFPIFLSAPDYESRVNDIDPITINVSFRYTYYDLLDINQESPCEVLT